MPKEENTPKPEAKKPDLTVVQEAEAAVSARIVARNEQLRMMNIISKDLKASAIIDDALADISMTIDQVSAKLMTELGKDTVPLNAPRPENYPMASGSIEYGDNRHHGEFVEAASDAILMRNGLHVEKPHPGAKDLRGYSALRMAETILGHAGRRGFGSESPLQIVRAVQMTTDFPLLLANVADKALQAGYENEPASHRQWCHMVDVKDFKPVSRIALSEAPALELKAEGAAYTTGTLSERAESYQLKTYGRMLEQTREAIINDDLGGFTRLPQAFGASAARKEADLVYSLLISNPAMSDATPLFHADHNNLVDTA